MTGIERIFDKEKTCLAIIIHKDYSTSMTEFYSDPEFSQQVGIISYQKCGKIKPHIHNKIIREVIYTQEVLFMRKGKMRVDIFDNDLKYVASKILNQGDVIFLITGGHGFEMLEDAEMLEVKQGPYSGISNDKTHFDGVLDDSSK